MLMIVRLCLLCNEEFYPNTRTLYCDTCRASGEARKDIINKYNHSTKGRIVQDRHRKTDKRRYYKKNKGSLIKRALTTDRAKTISRTNAHDKVRKLKIPRICVLCGVLEKLHVHHKDQNVFNNDITNLILLCSSCHGKEHEALNRNLTLLG